MTPTAPDPLDLELDATPQRYFDDVRVEALEPRLAAHNMKLPSSPEDPAFEPLLRDLGVLDPDLARDVRDAVRDELAEQSRAKFEDRGRRSNVVQNARKAPSRAFRTDNHKGRLQINPKYVRGALIGVAAVAGIFFIFGQPKTVETTNPKPIVDLNELPNNTPASDEPPIPANPANSASVTSSKAPAKTKDPRQTLSGIDATVAGAGAAPVKPVQVSSAEPPLPEVETGQVQSLDPEAGLRLPEDTVRPPVFAAPQRTPQTVSAQQPVAVTPSPRQQTSPAVAPTRSAPRTPSQRSSGLSTQAPPTSASKPIIIGDQAPAIQPIEVAVGGRQPSAATTRQVPEQGTTVTPITVAPVPSARPGTPTPSAPAPRPPMISVRGALNTAQTGNAQTGQQNTPTSGVLGVSARGQEPAVAARVRGVLSAQETDQAPGTGEDAGTPSSAAASNIPAQPSTAGGTQAQEAPSAQEPSPSLITVSAAAAASKPEQASGLHSLSVASSGTTTGGAGNNAGVIGSSAANTSSGLQSVSAATQEKNSGGLTSVNGNTGPASALPSAQGGTMPSATAATAKLPYRFGDMVKARLLTGAAFLQAEGQENAATTTTGGQVVYAQGEDGSRWRGTATLAANGRVMVTFDRVLVGEQDFAISGDAAGLEDARYQGVQPQVRRETPEAGRQLLQALLGSAAAFAQQSARAGTTTTTGSTVTTTQARPNFWLTSLGAVAQAVSLPSGRITRVVVSELPAGTSFTVVVRGQ